MKKCPFCAEEIQDEAIKCRFCGEFLDRKSPDKTGSQKTKWYFSTTIVVMAILCVGPLALPLVWLHPRYSVLTKTVVTVVVLVATVLLYYLTKDMLNQLQESLQALQGL